MFKGNGILLPLRFLSFTGHVFCPLIHTYTIHALVAYAISHCGADSIRIVVAATARHPSRTPRSVHLLLGTSGAW